MDVAWTAIVKAGVGLIGLKTTEPFWSLRNAVSWISNFLLLGLAAFGARALVFRKPPQQRVLWLCMVGSTLLPQFLLVALGPVALRYRIDFEPVLWILAAACLVQLVHRNPRTI